jgi:hypothetical protein
MNNSWSEGAAGIVVTSLIIGGILFLAAIVTPALLVGIPAYVGFRLWRDSPARAERLAKAETMILYQHAMAGQVRLSDAEIDAALSQHWSPQTPAPLRIQLLGVGRGLFEAEGLSPHTPPPPLLCNTVEGGRYRDFLAKQGQAKNDPQMLSAALEVISLALAPVANAAPPMHGDVLVAISQFLTPLAPPLTRSSRHFFKITDTTTSRICDRNWIITCGRPTGQIRSTRATIAAMTRLRRTLAAHCCETSLHFAPHLKSPKNCASNTRTS